MDLSGVSGASSSGAGRGGRRDDLTRRTGGGLVGEAGHLRPSRAAATEQWARQSRGGGSSSGGGGNLPRRGSDSSGLGMDAGKGM